MCSTCDVHYVCAHFDLISFHFDICTEVSKERDEFGGEFEKGFEVDLWVVIIRAKLGLNFLNKVKNIFL